MFSNPPNSPFHFKRFEFINMFLNLLMTLNDQIDLNSKLKFVFQYANHYQVLREQLSCKSTFYINSIPHHFPV